MLYIFKCLLTILSKLGHFYHTCNPFARKKLNIFYIQDRSGFWSCLRGAMWYMIKYILIKRPAGKDISVILIIQL